MYITINKQTKCIMARIRRQKKCYQENFTLKEYKTWDAAKLAAEKWAIKKLKDVPPRIQLKGLMTKKNKSGVVGVNLSKSNPRNKPNQIFYRWVARWLGCENSGGVSWSVLKYNYHDSFVLAVLARRKESIDKKYILEKFRQIKDKSEYIDIVNELNPDYQI